MPRPAPPLTPAASTDIAAKSGTVVAHDPSWTLPPAAMGGGSSSSSSDVRSLRGSVSSSSVASCNASDSSYQPNSPPATAASTRPTPSNASRKRTSNSSAVTASAKDDFNLPPPPTRCRKIIQMKPKSEQQAQKLGQDDVDGETAPAKTKASGGGRKKKGDGTTAAGRKIARKTAHSLIERRRRSKMNEEFGVLKDMIPACEGQDMHKLAILQASIEYMRYLEKCISELKASRRTGNPSPSEACDLTPPAPAQPVSSNKDESYDCSGEDEDQDQDQDEEMSDIDGPLSPTAAAASYPQSLHTQTVPSTNTSPLIYPVDQTDHSHFSATTSPAFGPVDRRPSNFSLTTSPGFYGMIPSSQQNYHRAFGSISTTTSPSIMPSPSVIGMSESRERHHSLVLSSPALGPQPDTREDHEAAMALGMLNSAGRTWGGEGGGKARGMSVRDLLSG
ncbi:uncharacterized protein K452DRAFT_284141 [Aplosporella prunicola CBS 121167]|uniref:BHLH domain-containing protein n=1 Tax=Aplosporella prunicola CBS 121167 TaxID=1176127 RepID=A0A6A6BQR0_9PEZI|nr:uncharacterized protein K452DRAFT_284141 [Aplosporella prunicola CBS 121167]KAF2145763.1 hypothetical protein K452DRAFT_284141 [Aplosporella prunicola CBS 121167]